MYKYTTPTISIYLGDDVDVDDIDIARCDIWQSGTKTAICGYFKDGSPTPSGYKKMTKNSTDNKFSYTLSPTDSRYLDADVDLDVQIRIKLKPAKGAKELSSKIYRAKVDDVLEGGALT